MSNDESNESNGNGEGDHTDTTPDQTPSEPTIQSPSPLEEADRINKEKASLLDREEKILERKEKLAAIEAVGGRARAGTNEVKKEQSNADYTKEVMEGKHDN